MDTEMHGMASDGGYEDYDVYNSYGEYSALDVTLETGVAEDADLDPVLKALPFEAAEEDNGAEDRKNLLRHLEEFSQRPPKNEVEREIVEKLRRVRDDKEMKRTLNWRELAQLNHRERWETVAKFNVLYPNVRKMHADEFKVLFRMTEENARGGKEEAQGILGRIGSELKRVPRVKKPMECFVQNIDTLRSYIPTEFEYITRLSKEEGLGRRELFVKKARELARAFSRV